jgi:YegS/Rv2252/BmrU family lipid kinase
MKRKVALIVKRKNNVDFIIDFFSQNNIDVVCFYISTETNPQELIFNLENESIFEVVLMGGDGTLHFWINQFIKYAKDFSVFRFGILPSGTGNDWVKMHYGKQANLKCILKRIVNGNSDFQDIGKVAFENQTDPIYFVNVSGIGFNGYVIKNLKYFKFLGSISYLISVLYSFWTYASKSIKFNCDKLQWDNKIFIISIAINQFAGGGMKISPNALSNDGLFDVLVIPKISIKDLFKNIFKLKSGNFIKNISMHHFRTSNLNIENQNNLIFEADGEAYEDKFYSISIHSQKLCFYN